MLCFEYHINKNAGVLQTVRHNYQNCTFALINSLVLISSFLLSLMLPYLRKHSKLCNFELTNKGNSDQNVNYSLESLRRRDSA